MVKRDLIRNIILIVIAILAFILLRMFIFSSFRVHEDASNTFLQKNDIVVVNKNVTPAYKDFIVYEVDGIFYISRVIGTPGDTVTVMDDILYINDVVQDESYIEEEKADYQTSNNQQVFTSDLSVSTVSSGKYTSVPDGTYLVLNDDRQNTNDSRKFGLIKKSQIRGVINFRLYPLDKFGFFDSEK
ncbi:signal peptidase I [Streptococcus loxodontisalivarius]|uniref:Signal peptidase I n=1 Tax=Streptococcus loxodontisalivarius TaxID=1349415 RepID=A0ABS2PPA8_9STRE|nr:signal peptidase I [Streptococcus loxodontisalivarius]MBM7641810.1 signal peptidase I [Streptococcus loxodontisalivarius]